MSWFDNLKEIVNSRISIIISPSITLNFNSNNNSKPFEYDKNKEVLSVNLKKLEPDDLEAIRRITNESLNEGRILLQKPSKERIADIRSKEESTDVQQLLTYFQDKIPPRDFSVLRQAVYIKKLFEEGGNSEVIYRLKGEVINEYGKRGLNICNLYSSGYFDSMIKPLFEESRKHGLDGKAFLSTYDVIINEEAFAVFVSGEVLSSWCLLG